MNVIERKIQTLEKLQSEIFLFARDVLTAHKDILISYNANEQLYLFGETSTGIPIKTFAPYKPKTIAIKRMKAQPVDRVTLKDTGAFHSSFDILFDDEQMAVVANDPKTEKLTFKYGNDILGISNRNLDEYVHQYFLNALMTLIKEEL